MERVIGALLIMLLSGCQTGGGEPESEGNLTPVVCTDDETGTEYNPMGCRVEIDGEMTWGMNAMNLCLDIAQQEQVWEARCFFSDVETMARNLASAAGRCYDLYGLDTCIGFDPYMRCSEAILTEIDAGCPLHTVGTASTQDIYFCDDILRRQNIDVTSTLR